MAKESRTRPAEPGERQIPSRNDAKLRIKSYDAKMKVVNWKKRKLKANFLRLLRQERKDVERDVARLKEEMARLMAGRDGTKNTASGAQPATEKSRLAARPFDLESRKTILNNRFKAYHGQMDELDREGRNLKANIDGFLWKELEHQGGQLAELKRRLVPRIAKDEKLRKKIRAIESKLNEDKERMAAIIAKDEQEACEDRKNHLAWRDQVQKAKEAHEAFNWSRKEAKRGDKVEQFYLGLYYAIGSGVVQDWTEAAKWYRKAAEQGVARAQFFLGCCYYQGKGVEENRIEAIKWYRAAARRGNQYAKRALRNPAVMGEVSEPRPTESA